MKHYDDPEVQELSIKMDDPDPGIRRVAVLSLVDCGAPEAAELLIRALKDPDPSVRQQAAKVVDEFDAEDIADSLLAALNDPDEVVRNGAAHALADLQDPSAAPPLLSALKESTDSFVSAAILRALKPLRVAEAQMPALERLKDDDPQVRREAVGVLGWLKAEENLPALINCAKTDADPEVRRAGTSALVYADGALVGSTLVNQLGDEHWQVRSEAALAIGKLQFSEGIPDLIELTHDKLWQVREKAADSLGKLQAVEAIDALGACTKDPMANLRKAAVCALGEIAHDDGRRFIDAAMDDPDPDVRKIARWAQSKLGSAA